MCRKISLLAFVAGAFFFINFISCDVGLGESVDTFPPKLSLDYPAGDSLVIRDTFVMKGIASDETSISSVTVSFNPTESSTAPQSFSKTYNAEFEPRGKDWTCTVNNKIEEKYEIPDGEYQVTIIATDSASRTSTVTRVYKIDNTAPFVVIKRPACEDSYGRTLKVTGDISDDNLLGSLEFIPYTKEGDEYKPVLDSNGNQVKFVQNNISGNGYEAIIARYYGKSGLTSDEQILADRYNAMFGVNKAIYDSVEKKQKKNLYYAVKVNDKAVSYPGNSVIEDGNVSENFYLYDDIYSDIYSDTPRENSKGLGLTNKQIVQILNGNSTGDIASSALEALAQHNYQCSPATDADDKLHFAKAIDYSISPDNSPTYQSSGYEFEQTGSSHTTIMNNGQVTISVAPGRDAYSLVKDSIQVVLKEAEYKSEKGTIVEKSGGSTIVLLEAPEIYNADGYSGAKTPAEWKTLRDKAISSNDANLMISTSIGDRVAGTYYLLVVNGRDAEENAIEAYEDKVYGFDIYENINPPTVKVTSSKCNNVSVQNNAAVKTADISVDGEVTSSTKNVKVKWALSVTDSNGSAALFSKTGEITCAKNSAGWNDTTHAWSYALSSSDISAIAALDAAVNPSYTKGVYQISLSFEAEDVKGNKSASAVTRLFILDTEAPALSDITVTPVVTFSDTEDGFVANREYVNGTISVISSVATDNYQISKTDYILEAVEAGGTRHTMASGTTLGSNIRITNLDTTVNSNAYDNCTLEVTLTSYDKAGNSANKTRTVYINQATDKPVIKITNADKTVTTESLITTEKNLFDLTANSKLRGSVMDDDGLKSVDIQWKKKGEADSAYKSLYGYPKTTASSSDSIDAKLLKTVGVGTQGLEEGVYWIKITATDKNDTAGSATFMIAVDDNDPSLSITTESGKFKGNPVTVEGSVSDSSGTVTLYRTPSFTETNGVVSIDPSKSDAITVNADGSFTDSFNPGTSGRTVTYTAYDKYLKSGTREFSYKIDLDPPVFDNTNPLKVKAGTKSVLASALSGVWFNDKNVTLTGGVKDANDISAIYMTLNGTETQFSGAKEFSLLSEYTQGSNTVALKFVDIAGNILSSNLSVNVDSVQPVISAAEISGKTGSTFVTKESSITLNVTASDATSGLSNILVGTSPSFAESEAKLNLAYASSVSLDISSWTEGSYSLYVRVTDKAGLSSTEFPVSGLVIDRTAPVISYTSHGQNDTVNKTITLAGTSSESNRATAPSPVLYYRLSATGGNAAGAWVTSSNTVNVDSTGAWNVSFVTTTLTSGKNYDFQIRMKDAAGNVTANTGAYRTLCVDQNSDRPVVKLNFNTDGAARLNSGTFGGTVTDDDGEVTSLAIKAVSDDSTFETTAWLPLTLNSGAWEIPAANKLTDGNYSLYFKVVDAKSETFITSATDGLAVPYIQYSSNPAVYAPVSFSIDTTAPSITLVDVSLNGGSYSNTNIQNNKILGGAVGKTAVFKIAASDTVSKGDNLSVTVDINGTVYTTAYGGASNKFYYTESIDLSGFTSGIDQLSVVATDQAGMTQSFTKMVIIDNSAPDTIKNVSPSSTTEVTGDFEMTGLVQDDEDANSGIPATGAMWYYIPKYNERNTTGDANLANLAWTTDNLTQTSVSWSIALGDLDDIIGYNSETETVGDNYSGYAVTGNTALYDIPIWFKVIDNAGNIGYITNNKLHFNPNADKPTIEITYPGESEKENGKIVMGGIARIQGSASDNEGIEAVYVQFDMDGDGTFENGAGISGAPKNASGKVYAGGDTSNVAVTIPLAGGTGFKAKGTLSWSTSIDLSGITMADGKTFNVRAIAIDTNGGDSEGRLISAWTEIVKITVNNAIPQITEANLVQYTDSTYATISKQVKYEDDIFLSGENWRLEGSVSHKDGIASVKATGSTTTVAVEKSGDTATFKIPVNVTSGSWEISLSADDNGTPSHTKTAQYSVNIDNLAPDFVDGASGELVLFKDAYGVQANILSSSVYLANNNGSYASIASKVHEAGSGFARAVFYFYKTGTGGNRVYNVMEGSSNKTVITTTKTVGSVYFNDENLPVLRATVTRPDKITMNVTTNKNIRIGGLVKIGGAYHKIADVTATSVSLESTDEVATKFTDVEFVYGMVVDNSGESMKLDGTITGDDGDGMVEAYAKSGSNIQWDATFPSANIPDGPVQIHVVVFDKAGNSSHGSVTTRLANNAPRITSVKLATDLNGNGTYEASEYEKFYALANQSTASGVDIWSLDTKKEMGTAERFTVKQGLSVIPEFVGGTAPFKYAFTKSVADSIITSPVQTTSTVVAKGDLTVASTDAVTNAVTTSTINLTSNQIDSTKTAATGEDTDMTYQFSFWDSTEETTAGVDSSWTILNAKIHQDLKDGNAPTGYIRPFYWNNNTDNSLYQNSKNNGHIELEADWQNASGYSSSATSGQFDGDPKVSGKIVLRGLIHDDVRLGSLAVTFADFGSVTVSEYTDGAWSAYTDSTGGKILSAIVTTESIGQNGHLASYEIVVDTSKISGVTGTDKAITLTVKDASDNTFASAAANGMTSDTVTATYYASAAQVKEGKFYASLADAKAEASAITTITNPDMQLIKLSEAETGTGYYIYQAHSRTGYYRVDVVPYVTGITTELSSKLKTSVRDAYSRTSTGKYIVRSGESITFNGFNLSGAKFVKTEQATGVSEATENLTDGVLDSSKITSSGAYRLKVGSVYTMNNVNNDYASGTSGKTINADSSYEDKNSYAYNSMANNKGNSRLTDDIYINLWEFNNSAAKPESGELREPVMKINPKTGKIGFAFVAGPSYASMADGVNDSYKLYQQNYATFNNISMAFDDEGNSFGTMTGLDTYPQGNTNTYAGRFTFMTSKWDADADSRDDNYNYERKLRLEAIGVPGDSKCYVKGVYPEKYQMSETRFASPSIVATNHGTASSVYLAYYDSIQNQIRFRYGQTVPASRGSTLTSGNFDNFIDNTGLGDVTNTNNWNQFGNNGNFKYVMEANTSAFSLIAGSDWQKYQTSSGTAGYTNKVGSNYFYDTGYSAGKFVCLDAYAGASAAADTVVAVWYDGKDCRYAYTTNPTSGNDNGTEGGWSGNKVIFSDGGEYCSVKIGPDGSVHIAAYVDGCLRYAYLSSVDASYNEATDSVLVDSYGDSGKQITLDVGRKEVSSGSYVVVPYIGYYSGGCMRPATAQPVIPSTGVMNYKASGVDSSNFFTGNWEVSVIPTSSSISDNVGTTDKINIGLWKKSVTSGTTTTKGIITGCKDSAFTAGNGTSSSGSSSGNCYGNGTVNPVFGYSIKDKSGTYITVIETAQLK